MVWTASQSLELIQFLTSPSVTHVIYFVLSNCLKPYVVLLTIPCSPYCICLSNFFPFPATYFYYYQRCFGVMTWLFSVPQCRHELVTFLVNDLVAHGFSLSLTAQKFVTLLNFAILDPALCCGVFCRHCWRFRAMGYYLNFSWFNPSLGNFTVASNCMTTSLPE